MHQLASMKHLASCLLLVACGTDAVPTGPTDPTPDPTPRTTTYWQDVEPIFYTHCQSCHVAGGIAPFAIDDPEVAIAFAPLIAEQTASRVMPPWPPGGDTPPLAHVRTLTPAQIETIQAWVENGAPLGDPATPRPHVEPEVVDIGATELGFDLGVDYVPDGNLTDDYRCFLVELDTTELRLATGFKVTPGNRATVHHVIVSLVDGDDRQALVDLDAETPTRSGWPCVGGAIPEGVDAKLVGSIGSWVPGVSAVAYPIGTGSAIPARSLAVVQMHYNLLGGMDPDRTRVDVALAPVESNGTLIRLGGMSMLKHNLQIEVDDASSVHEISATVQQWRALRGGGPFPSGKGYALGAGGHMHMLGTRISLTRTNPAGTTTLLDIPAWSFHWQGQYQFVTPIEVANSDTITLRCEYDNSNTNRLALGLPANTPVSWGEGTQDEMCLAQLLMTDTLP